MALLGFIFIFVLQFGGGHVLPVCNNQGRIYRTFKPGQDVVLPCGSPPASEPLQCSEMSWLYNMDQEDTVFQTRRGLVKQTSTRADRLSLDHNCSLVIKQATPEDAGRYTCRLGDSDCHDVTVFLSLPMCDNEERIYLTFKPGQDVVLPCGFPSASEPLPCSYISWLYNMDQEDTVIQTRRGLLKQTSTRADRLRMDDKCSLLIKHAIPEDAGRYTCRLGDSDCYDVTVFLSLPTVCNNEERIYLTFKPGQDVILPCGFPSAPEPLPCSYMSWLYNMDLAETFIQTRRGLLKKTSTRADRLSVDDKCSLVIKQVTPGDVGRYTCRRGDSDCYDVTVFLSLLTVFPTRAISDTWTNDEPIVECSLLRYMGASFFRPKSLRWVQQTGALISVGVTKSARDADYFCNMNVTYQSNSKFTCQAVNEENNVEIQADFTTSQPRPRCKTIAKADIVMLVDGSGSVTEKSFRIICKVLAQMVDAFDIGPNKVQIGFTQYSTDARTEWSLNAHSNKKSMKDAFEKVKYKDGGTNTGAALEYVLENDFKYTAGMRDDSRKIVLLLVDGTSNDKTADPSKKLRNKGIELYAIGVRDASTEELKGIASYPPDEHVHHIADFDDLYAILNGLSRNLCKSIRGPVDSNKNLFHFYQSKQDVTLPCGTPAPTGRRLPCSEMSWFHSRAPSEAFNIVNGGKINPRSLKTARMSLGADCSLVIKRVTDEDVGRYTCRWNDDDRFRVNVYLSLFTIHQMPTSRYLTELSKDDVALQCKVWKFPDYTPCGPNSFSWFNETGAVMTNPIRSSSCESTLIVTRQSGYNQTFTCQFVVGENNVVMRADHTPVFPEIQEDGTGQ